MNNYLNDFLSCNNSAVVHEFEESGEFGDTFIITHIKDDCFILENRHGQVLDNFRRDVWGLLNGEPSDGYKGYIDLLKEMKGILFIPDALSK